VRGRREKSRLVELGEPLEGLEGLTGELLELDDELRLGDDVGDGIVPELVDAVNELALSVIKQTTVNGRQLTNVTEEREGNVKGVGKGYKEREHTRS
jgi:hypothetical protein